MTSRVLDIHIKDGLTDVSVSLNGKATKVFTGMPEAKIKEYFQNKLKNSRPEILPPAVRYLSPDRTALIWERKPGYHTINYSAYTQNRLKLDSNSMSRYRIPVPWQVYLIFFNEDYVVNNLYMWFRSSPLSEEDRSGGVVPLNNFYSDNRLCPALYNDIPEANNLFQMLNNVYNMIWNSGFNEDLHDALSNAFGNVYSGLKNKLLHINASDRSKFYREWAKLKLSDVVEAVWPTHQTDIFEYAKTLSSISTNVKVNQLLLDLMNV